MTVQEHIRVIDLLYHFSARPSARVVLGSQQPSAQSRAGNPARLSPAPCPEAPVEVLADMDAAGIERAFISQCKKWSCERQWLCADTKLEDVQRYLAVSRRFVGLAGYNPFDIAESLREIEFAVGRAGFRGVYLHPEDYRLPLTDERVYPVLAKASELGVPVLAQFTADAPLETIAGGLGRVASDMPELVLAIAHPRPKTATLNELAKCENLFFVLDSGVVDWLAARKEERGFLVSDVFRTRTMWGSNGQSWSYARAGWERLELAPDATRAWLHDNAARAFRLDADSPSRLPGSVVEDPMAAER